MDFVSTSSGTSPGNSCRSQRQSPNCDRHFHDGEVLLLKVLFVEEHTSAYERKLSVCASDVMGAAVRLVVCRPELREGAAVEDARERPENPAVRDNENGLGIAL